ncbi:MAG: hypothetical protein ACTS73_07125 [Arsenophonus sp. NEOnobi-MAG3]
MLASVTKWMEPKVKPELMKSLASRESYAANNAIDVFCWKDFSANYHSSAMKKL